MQIVSQNNSSSRLVDEINEGGDPFILQWCGCVGRSLLVNLLLQFFNYLILFDFETKI